MTLKEQLLSELSQQNEIAQKEIKDLESTISGEMFAQSTLSGGLIAAMAESACDSRIQRAQTQKDEIKKQNAWISEMLSKYK